MSSRKLEIAFGPSLGGDDEVRAIWCLGTFDMQGRKQQLRLGVKGEHSSLVGNRLYYNLCFLVDTY